MSSKPTTESSRGTSRPTATAALSAANAIRSLRQKIAVGDGSSVSSSTASRYATSYEYHPTRINDGSGSASASASAATKPARRSRLVLASG